MYNFGIPSSLKAWIDHVVRMGRTFTGGASGPEGLLVNKKVIVISARDGLGNQKRAFDAGAKAFLQKPVDDKQLLAVIRQALGEPAATKKPTLHDQGAV